MSIELIAGVFQEIYLEFEERVGLGSETGDKVGEIMKGEKTPVNSRITMYETALRGGLKSMNTVEGLEQLVKNFERVCRKKLTKKHPLYQEYQEKMDSFKKPKNKKS